MRLLAVTDDELELLREAIEVMFMHRGDGRFTELRMSLGGRALPTRCPPALQHDTTGYPQHRGPRRAIRGRLFYRDGMDALLLECGHVVARRTRKQPQHTHCAACAVCQELDE
ncbi:MAG: hypothetical protein MJA83_11725 [Gammaproteobacteria bacterium]|nr:hypothetical protein [Gammaproteobacteria bacterium]